MTEQLTYILSLLSDREVRKRSGARCQQPEIMQRMSTLGAIVHRKRRTL